MPQTLQPGQDFDVLEPWIYTANQYTKLIGPSVPYQGEAGDWANFVPGWHKEKDTVNGITLTTRSPWTAISGEKYDVLGYTSTGGGGISAVVDFRTPTMDLIQKLASHQKNVIAAKAQVQTLAITTGATTAGNVAVTLNGVATTVAVAASDTPTQVATKIAAATYAGWAAVASGALITFTASDTNAKLPASFDGGATGVTGTMATTVPATQAHNTRFYRRSLKPIIMLGFEGTAKAGAMYAQDTYVRGFILAAQNTVDSVLNIRDTGADAPVHLAATLEATSSQITPDMLAGTGYARSELDPAGKFFWDEFAAVA